MKKRFLLSHRKEWRREAVWQAIRWLLTVGILGAILFGFLFSGRFQVRVLEFSGLNRTDEAKLRVTVEEWMNEKKFFIPYHRIIWLLPLDTLRTLILETFPTVKEVSIDRKFSGTLAFHVREYSGWGVLCHGEPEICFWIDRNGIAFEPAAGYTGIIVPKILDERAEDIRVGDVKLSQQMMHLITYFNERAVDDSNLQSLQFIVAKKNQTLEVRTRAGWYILLLDSVDPEAAYKNLRTVLNTELKDKISRLDYVDLRFGNRVFYRFKE